MKNHHISFDGGGPGGMRLAQVDGSSSSAGMAIVYYNDFPIPAIAGCMHTLL